jgi:hypothetical protein
LAERVLGATQISNETENKTMNYSKPELVALDNALTSIQGQTKMGAVPDAVVPHNRPSVSAYEADE